MTTNSVEPTRPPSTWTALRDLDALIAWSRRIPDGLLTVHRVAVGHWQWRRHDRELTVVEQVGKFKDAQLARAAADAAVGDPPCPARSQRLTPISPRARVLVAALNVSGA